MPTYTYGRRGRVEVKTVYANGVCRAVRDERVAHLAAAATVAVVRLIVTDQPPRISRRCLRRICEGGGRVPSAAERDYPNPP